MTDRPKDTRVDELERLEDRIRQARSALTFLGTAWRLDWSDFDGRTLRAQLDDISAILEGRRTSDQFLAGASICASHSCWLESCPPECRQ